MCCIFGFIKWSISCIQRSLTLVLGFWVVLMVLYALGLAISAGVAFGYDYCLAEYTVLARSDMQLQVKTREYVPEQLYRRSGSLTGIMAEDDEYKPSSPTSEPLLHLADFIPTWLYHASPKYTDLYSKQTQSVSSKPTQSVSSKPTRTAKRKKLKKVSKVSKATRTTRRGKTNQNTTKIDSSTSTPTRTKVDSTSSTFQTVSSTSTPTRTKLDSTSPKLNVTKSVLTSERTNNPWLTNVIRMFVPKSTYNMKWRPTKPQKFFYKTTSVHQRKKTKEDSYHPEMEIRIPPYGKHMGLPMRHWDVPTAKTTEPDTSHEENYDKNFLYF